MVCGHNLVEYFRRHTLFGIEAELGSVEPLTLTQALEINCLTTLQMFISDWA